MESTNDRVEVHCPQCGGERMSWRVMRPSGELREGTRTIEWKCRDCDAVWTECVPLDDQPEAG